MIGSPSLDIGAGPRSSCDVQMDMFKWNDKIIVHDIVDTPWPLEDNSFAEVRAEQVLEHIPAVAYFPAAMTDQNGDVYNGMTHINPRVMVMKEIYRVLKPGGLAHISVPISDQAFEQDPTHIGPKWTEGMFNYFCGEWGGNHAGEFVNDAYGVNFAFKKEEVINDGYILTIRLRK